jgi:hypothetical protein
MFTGSVVIVDTFSRASWEFDAVFPVEWESKA